MHWVLNVRGLNGGVGRVGGCVSPRDSFMLTRIFFLEGNTIIGKQFTLTLQGFLMY